MHRKPDKVKILALKGVGIMLTPFLKINYRRLHNE